MNYLQLLIGMATNVPGVYKLFSRTHGTDSARYCYSVWLRHLVMAHKQRLITGPPQVIAELGPGDSLGIGLAALIAGTDTYYALDVVHYANVLRNLKIFDELVELFRHQKPVPNDSEFPRLAPRIEAYQFPSFMMDQEWLAKALDSNRIQRIRNSLEGLGHDGKDHCISYIVPWDDPAMVHTKTSSIDMIYSQAVLEHVDNLGATYATLSQWLKPAGFMSHQIDFTSHRITRQWNGQWTYSDCAWRLLRGKRSWFLNRQPYSVHKDLLLKCGFNVVNERIIKDVSGIKRSQLAPQFRDITDADLQTRAAFVQATKTR